LRAGNQVGPLILVFPGLSSEDNTVQSVGTNMRAPQLAKVDGIGTGRFEDYLLQELIPYVDSHYRTVATREGRGVDGFSLGATMATRLALAHPDRFRTVGAFDGLYFWPTADCAGIDSARDKAFNDPLFDPALGVPRDIAFAAANNAPNLLCQATPAQAQSLAWFIQYGPESAEPNNSNYYRGAALVQQLAGKGVTNGFSDPVLPGGHHWSTADEHLRQVLPLHWQVLGPAAK
jgi:S-formylglutathione hydrolase FrmB